MAVNISFIGGAGWQFFDDNGDPLSGGKIYTYAAGTTTPLTTYTSRDGNVPNTNPIILDAAGRTPQEIWSTEGLLYKYVVKTSNDVLIRTWDNIGGSVVSSDLGQDLANTTDNAKGDALIGFRQSNSVGFLPGAVSRTVNAKLQEIVSVKDFGAVGDGVTDDTDALNAAGNAVRGTDDTLHIPPGNYLASSLVDFTRVRNISSEGIILSNVTSGAAVRIGTESSANIDMQGGDIELTVTGVGSNNGRAGTSGIQLRGSARCNFRLYAYNWDIGVDIAPQGGTGIQYVAWNRFQLYTNGCRTGLKFNGFFSGGNGWINENTFIRVDCYPQNNQLPGDYYGCWMTGEYPSNNNTFLASSFEGQLVPIWIQTGFKNSFYATRFELAGSVRFGDNATPGDKPVAENFVQTFYPSGPAGVEVDWQASRPNMVCANDTSPAWVPVFSSNFDDFLQVGSEVYSTKLLNSTTGTGYFQYGTLNSANRSFDPGSNHRAVAYVKVQKGDILRIYQSNASGDYPRYALLALDASKTALPSISSTQTPYLGTNATIALSGTSGVNSFMDVNNAGFLRLVLLSINRDEVQWLRVDLFPTIANIALSVERLINTQNIEDGRVEALNPVKAVSSFATAPQYAGQTGIVSSTRVAIGCSSNAWVQLGQVSVAATAAEIASATNAVNTANKVAGLMVRDTTNNRIMVASGALPTSVWYRADGGASVTPA